MTEENQKELPTTPEMLFKCFDKLGIKYKTTSHPAVFTAEEGAKYWGNIEGLHCKNLFCKDAKGVLWLIVAPAEKRVDLKSMPAKIGCKRLSFASADLLYEKLGITPGSVTPFCLINDKERHEVRPVLDKWMMEQPIINFHPLTNTATTTLTPQDLMKFIRYCGHEPLIADVTSD